MLRLVTRLQRAVPLSEPLRCYNLCIKVFLLAVVACVVKQHAHCDNDTFGICDYKIMGISLNCVKERHSLVAEVPESRHHAVLE